MARHLLTAAALAFALSGVACGSARPPGSRFPRAVNPVAQDWATVLRRDAHVNLEIWETGRVRVARKDILDFADPKVPAKFAKDDLFVPVYAHLLRHDERGAFLIDAGLDRSFSRVTSGDMQGLFARRFYAVQRPGEDVVSRLDNDRIALRGIFFTHLHPDHASGAESLPRDIPFIVGKGERPKSYSFLLYNDALHDVIGLDEIDFAGVPAMPPLGPSLDVFGDGSVWAIHTPGHTNSHLSFVVVTKTGPVLFTGDVSHTRWGFDNDVVPGGSSDGDPKDSRRSLDQLRAFAKTYPEVRVVYGHEL